MQPIAVGDVLASTRRGTPVEVSAITAILVQRPETTTWVSPGSELHHIHKHVAETVIPTLVKGFALTKAMPPDIDLDDTGATATERIRTGNWKSAQQRLAELTQAALEESEGTAPHNLSSN